MMIEPTQALLQQVAALGDPLKDERIGRVDVEHVASVPKQWTLQNRPRASSLVDITSIGTHVCFEFR